MKLKLGKNGIINMNFYERDVVMKSLLRKETQGQQPVGLQNYVNYILISLGRMCQWKDNNGDLSIFYLMNP